MSGGKETLKGSMYSGIYISLNFELCFRSGKKSITQLKEERYTVGIWERTSEGVVRTLLRFPYLDQFF
jgi:hypothetical protein